MSFLGIDTFPIKKKPPELLETTQKARWFQISKFETTVKPLWFHKKRQLSKISLEIVIYCVKKYHIFENSKPNISEIF